MLNQKQTMCWAMEDYIHRDEEAYQILKYFNKAISLLT